MESISHIPVRWRRLCVIAFVLLLPLVAGIDCYNPDGTVIESKDYRPCNTTAEHSMCCATNRDQIADTCLPNGLCFNPWNCGDKGCVKDGIGLTWRESCTDPTWRSPDCVQACFSGANRSVTDTRITPCGPTKGFDIYCCGENNTACCKAKQGFAIINLAVVAIDDLPSTTTSASSTTSATSKPTTSTTPPPNPATAGATTSDDGLPTSTKIAIGVSVGVGAVLIIIAIIFFRRRHKRKNYRAPEVTPMLYNHDHNHDHGAKSNAYDTRELGAMNNKASPTAFRAELTGGRGGAELPGQSVPVEVSQDNYSPRHR